MNPVTYTGDLRKLTGRVPLSPAMREARIKFKSRAWDQANMDKRRESSRNSKRKLRLLYGRKPEDRPVFWSLDRPSEYTGRNLYNVVDSYALSPLEILIAEEEAA